MGSLLNDGCAKKAAKGTKCRGCICELLEELANQSNGNLCSMGRPQRLLIKQKGTSTPVSLDGSGIPTVFELVKFDSESCCAVFRFEEVDGTSPMTTTTRTFVEDCNAIAGIVCINNENSQ